MKHRTILKFILLTLLLSGIYKFSHSQVNCRSLDSITQEIIQANYYKENLYITGMSSKIGLMRDSQYLRFEELVRCASTSDLIKLLASDNNTLLAFSWKAILWKEHRSALNYLIDNFETLKNKQVLLFTNYCQGEINVKLNQLMLNELTYWLDRKQKSFLKPNDLLAFKHSIDSLKQSQIPIYGKYAVQSDYDFSILELNEDETFLFKYRTGSSLIRADRTGNYQICGDTLILQDTYQWKDPFISSQQFSTNRDNIKIQIQDDKGVPLANAICKFQYKANGKEHTKISNNKGEIYFKKKRLSIRKNNKSFLYVKIKIEEQEISSAMYIDKKIDEIKYTITPFPKSQKKERQEYYLISLHELTAFERNSLDSNMKYERISQYKDF